MQMRCKPIKEFSTVLSKLCSMLKSITICFSSTGCASVGKRRWNSYLSGFGFHVVIAPFFSTYQLVKWMSGDCRCRLFGMVAAVSFLLSLLQVIYWSCHRNQSSLHKLEGISSVVQPSGMSDQLFFNFYFFAVLYNYHFPFLVCTYTEICFFFFPCLSVQQVHTAEYVVISNSNRLDKLGSPSWPSTKLKIPWPSKADNKIILFDMQTSCSMGS